MTLKDYVHSQLLTWNEFLALDKETQEKWREIHLRKNREEQIKAHEMYLEFLEQQNEA